MNCLRCSSTDGQAEKTFPSHSVYYALHVVIEEPSHDGDERTLVPQSNSLRRTMPANLTSGSSHLSNNRANLGRSLNLDDRPITPMKDRMVYDREHSSLDFKDGMPEDPKIAETYYSQFDEFEDSFGEVIEPDVEIIHHDQTPNHRGDYNQGYNQARHEYDEESDEENEGTIIGAVGAVPGGTVRAAAGTVRTAEGTVRGGTVHGPNVTYSGGTVAGEEAALIRQMENHLSTLNPGDGSDEDEDYNEDTMTLADDTVAGAFGPTARSIKINNLRRNGETKLGKAPFKKAYEFLKKMRYGDDNAATVDESHIMAQLRQITPNISDCFIIDQLLFLEKQADIDKNS